MPDLPDPTVNASLVWPPKSSCDLQITPSLKQTSIIVTPEMIRPIPKATARKRLQRREA